MGLWGKIWGKISCPEKGKLCRLSARAGRPDHPGHAASSDHPGLSYKMASLSLTGQRKAPLSALTDSGAMSLSGNSHGLHNVLDPERVLTARAHCLRDPVPAICRIEIHSLTVSLFLELQAPLCKEVSALHFYAFKFVRG